MSDTFSYTITRGDNTTTPYDTGYDFTIPAPAVEYSNGALRLSGLVDAYPAQNCYRSTTPLSGATTSNYSSQGATLLPNAHGNTEGNTSMYGDLITDSSFVEAAGTYYYYFTASMSPDGQDELGNDYWTLQLAATVVCTSSGSGTPAELTSPTDFTATRTVSGVLCQFTLPEQASSGTTISWQHTTTDPTSGTPGWVSLAITDRNGDETM